MAFKSIMNVPQTQLLLNHFRVKPSISPMEAAGMFRVRSLSRRINDLEAQGHVFSREQATDTTGQRYVRYHYLGRAPAPRPMQDPASIPARLRGSDGLALAQR